MKSPRPTKARGVVGDGLGSGVVVVGQVRSVFPSELLRIVAILVCAAPVLVSDALVVQVDGLTAKRAFGDGFHGHGSVVPNGVGHVTGLVLIIGSWFSHCPIELGDNGAKKPLIGFS